MRKFALLCDTNYILNHTVIDKNVDSDLINRCIEEAQEISIQQVLGNALYTKIMADIVDQTLPSEYESFLQEYIQPALARWTVYYALPWMNYKLTNKNVGQRNSDSSESTQLRELQYLRESIRNQAEFLSQRITQELVNNQGVYIEWLQSNQIGAVKSRKNNYFSGMQIDGGSGSFCQGPWNYTDLTKKFRP